jgi:hypothetical protein
VDSEDRSAGRRRAIRAYFLFAENKAWRWRQLYPRSLLDPELKTNGGRTIEA